MLACTAGKVAAAENDGATPVAEVNGHKLTLNDLENKKQGKLLTARYQFYLAQRQALDEMIDEYLLQQVADREHLTIDKLLEKKADKQIKDVTDDQLEVYYEGLQTDQPFESMKDKIREHIRRNRINKARIAYIKGLRDKEKVVVTLAPPSATVALEGSPVQGPDKAPVTLVEFADFECPYCAKIHPDIKKLREQFGDKLRIAYKELPLPMHQHAEKASEASLCAGDQGKFWEYHDALFDNPKDLDVAHLKQRAGDLKLDQAKFDKCVDSGEKQAAVKKDLDEANRLGITGTPSFFVNDHFVSGAVDYATLRDLVEQQLNASKENPPTGGSM
jgi:protein-disulfide isomerase